MRIIFLGPQGAGKGTIASLVSAKLKIPHISVGDMFRDAIEARTLLGKEAKKHIDKGKLVPDSITNELMRERIAQKDCKKGFILDGYPRNINQAQSLDSFAIPTHVILLDIPEQVSIERLAGRRQCSKCKHIFHIKTLPPKKEGICDACGGQLYVRNDDKPAVIKQRLALYRTETEPIIYYYQKQKKLHHIDATPTVEFILKEALRVLR
ncbi:adenylate kinase [Candidatus Woesearchaeota archaeon]|nr:adenylate kinase [Candidatus Woesearchaeota archaeon]